MAFGHGGAIVEPSIGFFLHFMEICERRLLRRRGCGRPRSAPLRPRACLELPNRFPGSPFIIRLRYSQELEAPGPQRCFLRPCALFATKDGSVERATREVEKRRPGSLKTNGAQRAPPRGARRDAAAPPVASPSVRPPGAGAGRSARATSAAGGPARAPGRAGRPPSKKKNVRVVARKNTPPPTQLLL